MSKRTVKRFKPKRFRVRPRNRKGGRVKPIREFDGLMGDYYPTGEQNVG